MKGSASSSWPTATGTDANGARSFGADGIRIRANAGPTLNDKVANWGTPRASDGEKGGPNQSFGAGGMPLPAQAAQWTTPSHSDGRRGGTGITESMSGSSLTQKVAQWPTTMAEQVMQASAWPTPSALQDTKGDTANVAGRMEAGKQMALAHVARDWPTPAARDFRTPNSQPLIERTGSKAGEQLPNVVAHGFTRPDLPTWQGGLTHYRSRPGSRRLLRSVTSHVSRTKLRQWLKRGWWRKRRLNPLFVEWLMGWPSGHALCASSATEFIRWQQDMRGALSQLPTASGPWIWAPQVEPQQSEQMTLFG